MNERTALDIRKIFMRSVGFFPSHIPFIYPRLTNRARACEAPQNSPLVSPRVQRSLPLFSPCANYGRKSNTTVILSILYSVRDTKSVLPILLCEHTTRRNVELLPTK